MSLEDAIAWFKSNHDTLPVKPFRTTKTHFLSNPTLHYERIAAAIEDWEERDRDVTAVDYAQIVRPIERLKTVSPDP